MIIFNAKILKFPLIPRAISIAATSARRRVNQTKNACSILTIGKIMVFVPTNVSLYYQNLLYYRQNSTLFPSTCFLLSAMEGPILPCDDSSCTSGTPGGRGSLCVYLDMDGQGGNAIALSFILGNIGGILAYFSTILLIFTYFTT